MNDKKNRLFQNLWDAVKTVFIEKCIAFYMSIFEKKIDLNLMI